MAAAKLLSNQLREMQREPVEGVLCELMNDDLFEWKVWIEGPQDTPFVGGIFETRLSFPSSFPLEPPSLRFLCDFWHPNGLLFSFSFSFSFHSFHSIKNYLSLSLDPIKHPSQRSV